MNCDCIADLEKRLTEKLKSGDDLAFGRPRGGKFKSVHCSAFVFRLTAGGSLQIPFGITWEYGIGGHKTTSLPVMASHCPFCGKPIDEEKGGK